MVGTGGAGAPGGTVGRDTVRRIGDRVPQRRVPGLAGPRGRGFGARRTGQHRARGQLHLIRNVAGHHESEPLAGLRRDVHRVGEFDLLLLEFGDLRPQPGLGGGQLFHLGPLGEVRTHRPGDGQGEHAHHGGEDRRPPGRRAEPLLGLLLGRLRNGFPDRVGAVVRSRAPASDRESVARGSRRAGEPRPRTAAAVARCPTHRPSPAARPGTAASGRAASLRARAIWPPGRSAGTPGRRRTGRRRRGSPRCAAAGCTWRRVRYARAHPS